MVVAGEEEGTHLKDDSFYFLSFCLFTAAPVESAFEWMNEFFNERSKIISTRTNR